MNGWEIKREVYWHSPTYWIDHRDCPERERRKRSTIYPEQRHNCVYCGLRPPKEVLVAFSLMEMTEP
jgi:hypothetical protein